DPHDRKEKQPKEIAEYELKYVLHRTLLKVSNTTWSCASQAPRGVPCALFGQAIRSLVCVLLNPRLWIIAQILCRRTAKMSDDIAHNRGPVTLHHSIEP